MTWIKPNIFQFQNDFLKQNCTRKSISVPALDDFKPDGRCLELTLNTLDIEDSKFQTMEMILKENGNYRKASYGVRIKVSLPNGLSHLVIIENGKIPTYNDPCTKKLFKEQETFLNWENTITVIFTSWSWKTSGPLNTIYHDLMEFVLLGSQVTLLGNDGNVTVPRRLLKARSPALAAMFTHDMQEKQLSQIDMCDFNTKVLEGFKNFLIKDIVVFDKDIIIDLYTLGDKYNIKCLKLESRKLILRHIQELDSKNVYKIISKIDPDVIEQLFMQQIAL